MTLNQFPVGRLTNDATSLGQDWMLYATAIDLPSIEGTGVAAEQTDHFVALIRRHRRAHTPSVTAAIRRPPAWQRR